MLSPSKYEDPMSIAQHYYCVAYSCYPEDYQRAYELLNLALNKNPLHAPSLSLIGQIYLNQFNDLNKAALYFQKAINSDSNYLLAHEYYIEFLLQIKDFDLVQIAIQNTLKVPGACFVYIEITKARILELQGKNVQALNALNTLLDVSNSIETDAKILSHINRIHNKISSPPQHHSLNVVFSSSQTSSY